MEFVGAALRHHINVRARQGSELRVGSGSDDLEFRDGVRRYACADQRLVDARSRHADVVEVATVDGEVIVKVVDSIDESAVIAGGAYASSAGGDDGCCASLHSHQVHE